MKPVALAVVAFVAGMLITMGFSEDRGASAPAPRAPDTRRIPAAVNLQAIRTTIRQELAAGRPDSPAPSAGTAAPEPSTPSPVDGEAPTAEPAVDPEAVYLARSIVDDGLAVGVWDDQRRSKLRDALAEVDAAERERITLGLIRALNRGDLAADIVGPPI